MRPGWPLYYTWSTGEESPGLVLGPSPKGADYLAIEYEWDGKTAGHSFHHPFSIAPLTKRGFISEPVNPYCVSSGSPMITVYECVVPSVHPSLV